MKSKKVLYANKWFHKILFADVTGTGKGFSWNYNTVDYFNDGSNSVLIIYTLKTMFYWTLNLNEFTMFKTLVVTGIMIFFIVLMLWGIIYREPL